MFFIYKCQEVVLRLFPIAAADFKQIQNYPPCPTSVSYKTPTARQGNPFHAVPDTQIPFRSKGKSETLRESFRRERKAQPGSILSGILGSNKKKRGKCGDRLPAIGMREKGQNIAEGKLWRTLQCSSTSH
ncbi:hypothetical protein CEXT_654361 [Caerostris extrusa]|uniref:Uncharacterized protein n=1 Tax=Caerostris extrusa TaxID=172846 RepID=A0AAV4NC57_CAEEX|nr:hypothetical protein CEXT_654361 [Caerostris extrusa]